MLQARDIYHNATTDICHRIYYAQEGRILRPVTASDKAESRPQTRNSRSSFAYGGFRARPEPRPQVMPTESSHRDSMAINPVSNPAPNSEAIADVQASPRQRVSPSWSPHLWHDRRSAVNRRTIFVAPSLDEGGEGNAPTRRNLQVWMFVVGFLFTPGMLYLCCAGVPSNMDQPGLLPLSSLFLLGHNLLRLHRPETIISCTTSRKNSDRLIKHVMRTQDTGGS